MPEHAVITPGMQKSPYPPQLVIVIDHQPDSRSWGLVTERAKPFLPLKYFPVLSCGDPVNTYQPEFPGTLFTLLRRHSHLTR